MRQKLYWFALLTFLHSFVKWPSLFNAYCCRLKKLRKNWLHFAEGHSDKYHIVVRLCWTSQSELRSTTRYDLSLCHDFSPTLLRHLGPTWMSNKLASEEGLWTSLFNLSTATRCDLSLCNNFIPSLLCHLSRTQMFNKLTSGKTVLNISVQHKQHNKVWPKPLL
jgi:hypothetical protein